jgi:hypothetical protein
MVNLRPPYVETSKLFVHKFWHLNFGLLLAALFGFITTRNIKKIAELQTFSRQNKRTLLTEIKFKTIFLTRLRLGTCLDSFSGRFLNINEQYCRLDIHLKK